MPSDVFYVLFSISAEGTHLCFLLQPSPFLLSSTPDTKTVAGFRGLSLPIPGTELELCLSRCELCQVWISLISSSSTIDVCDSVLPVTVWSISAVKHHLNVSGNVTDSQMVHFFVDESGIILLSW